MTTINKGELVWARDENTEWQVLSYSHYDAVEEQHYVYLYQSRKENVVVTYDEVRVFADVPDFILPE